MFGPILRAIANIYIYICFWIIDNPNVCFLSVSRSMVVEVKHHWWVVWNMFYFSIYIYIFFGNVIIPTDFHSIMFQRGRSTIKPAIFAGSF